MWGTGDFYSDSTYSADTWNHVVLTIERNGNAYFYINGVQDGSKSVNDIAIPFSKDLLIGGYDKRALFFNGSIDDVRIYNRALSQAEITLLYNSYNPILRI